MARSAIESLSELTPLQEGLLFHNQNSNGQDAYCVQLSYKVTGDLSVEHLRGACQLLQERHAALRTSFVWRSQREPRQVVRREVRADFEVVDLQGVSGNEQSRVFERLQSAQRREGFDLQRPPLLRWRVVKISPREHWLIKTHHHIVLDGWSSSIVMRDLAALYYSLSTGRPVGLEPTTSFQTYLSWLRDKRRRSSSSASEQFWRRQFLDYGMDSNLRLSGHVEPGSKSASGSRVHCRELGREATERLTREASAAGLTVNTLVQGAWFLLLSRYTGSSDNVVGVTVAGRPEELAGSERTVGLFINTLPLRGTVRGDLRLRDWLEQLQLRNVDLRDHAHEALADIQRHIGVPPGQKLFDSLLVFENFPRAQSEPVHATGLSIEPLSVKDGTHYGLTLYVAPGEDLRIRLTHNTSQFSGDAVRVLLKQFCESLICLTDGLRDNPAQQVRSWLSDAAAGAAMPPHSTLPSRWTWTDHGFAPWFDSLSKWGERTALCWEGGQLNYAQLRARVARLGHALRSQGLGPGQRVGLLLQRGPSVPVALLASLSAGVTFVPIDPQYPRPRVEWMLNSSSLDLVLTEGEPSLRFPCRHWLLSEGALVDCPVSASVDWVPSSVEASSPAYMIYTSGTTGTPKGVVLSCANLYSFLAAMAGDLHMTPEDSWLAVTSLSFDISLLEQLLPLRQGATLRLASAATARDGVRLSALLDGQELQSGGRQFFQATPATYKLLLASEWLGHSTLHLLCGGEALPSELLSELRTRCATVRNVYGPTETTIWSSQWLCDDSGAVRVGSALAGESLHVLDASGLAQPLGAIGELHIGGEGVALGYEGEPSLTAERFVPDPWGAAGSRLYKTGDLVRWDVGTGDPSLKLEHLGRSDRQIKLRGHRIELQEIERATLALKEVLDVAVVLDDEPEPHLVAHWVRSEGAGSEVEATELRLQLGETLPAALIPSGWVEHERLPLTSNGKLDHKALPKGEARGSTASVFTTPTGPGGEFSPSALLAPIWQDVLGVQKVHASSHFFEQGGHSLLAVRLAARAGRALGGEVPVQLVFDTPNFGQFVHAAIEATQGVRAVEPKPPAHCERETEVERLSFAQERLWFLEQLQPGAGRYDVCFGIKLKGPFNEEALGLSVEWLAQRHDVLRSRFFFRNGKAIQTFESSGQSHLRLADNSEPRHQRNFDWSQESPWSVTHKELREGADGCELVFRFHHILLDARSVEILLGDLHFAYVAYAQGNAPGARDQGHSYRDYIRWQRAEDKNERRKSALDHFRRVLSGIPTHLELPTDTVRGKERAQAGARIEFEFPAHLVALVHGTCAARDVTPFLVLLAAYGILVSRYSRENAFAVGVPISGRSLPEWDRVVGPFSNTLALPLNLAGDPSWLKYLEQIRQMALEAFAHSDLPFEQLVEALGAERTAGREPLIQALLAVDQNDEARSEFGGESESFEAVSQPRGPAKFDWLLHIFVTRRTIRGHLEYDSALFREGSARRAVQHFQQLLHCALRAPNSLLSELTLSEPSQTPTRTAVPVPVEAKHTTLTEGWRSQAQLVPNAVALRWQTQSLSYSDLERETAELAGQLRAVAVGPEVLVGLCLPRGFDWVVAMLSILRAGGAYLPMEPELPAQRKAWLAEDAGICVVVTSEDAWGHAESSVPRVLLEARSKWRSTPGDTGAESAPPAFRQHSDNLAYVLYTSGSTGKPKGVGISHKMVLRLFEVCNDRYRFSSADRWSVFHSLAFDFSVWELWGALLYGGCAVIVPEATRRDPIAFADLILEEEISILSQTPSAFLALQKPLLRKREGLSLRHVVFGGEILETDRLRLWFDAYGQGVAPCLTNMYGITETTVFVTEKTVDHGDATQPTASIGRPLRDLAVRLLDTRGKLAPEGTVAELCVAGEGVGRGYLGRPALTAERFVPDPWGAPGSRLYRSGDLATLDDTGELRYLRRMDQQVQLRGYRIELAEVASSLEVHSQIARAETAVLGTSEAARLVGYCQLSAGSEAVPTLAEVRAVQREVVPKHMLLDALVWLEAFPLTANGKLDRTALPAPLEAEAAVGGSPRTAFERRIADLFCATLECSQIGIDDNFFDRGGNSLLALSLMEELTRTLGASVPLTAFFQAPTVSRLSALLSGGSGDFDLQVELTARAGVGRALYCLHPGGGHVEAYRAVSERLVEQGWRCVGLQSRSVFDAKWRDESIDVLAAEYAELLSRTPPDDDEGYALLGWSSGGVLAAALASKLLAAGKKVACVALIDPPWPGAAFVEPQLREDRAAFEDQLERALVGLGAERGDSRLQLLSPNERRAWEVQVSNAGTPESARAVALELAQQKGWMSKNLTPALCEWTRAALTHTAGLLRAHSLSPLAGDSNPRVHLWRATRNSSSAVECPGARRWNEALGVAVEQTSMDETHSSIIESTRFFSSLAKWLREKRQIQ